MILKIKKFMDLKALKECRELAMDIYKITEKLLEKEKFTLTS